MEPPRNLRKQVIQARHPGSQIIITQHKIDTLQAYITKWEGRELARWLGLAVGHEAIGAQGFPVGSFFSVAVVRQLRFQLPPVKPCMRFSRTRLTDVLHRRYSAFQARKGLGGTTIPSRLIRPR